MLRFSLQSLKFFEGISIGESLNGFVKFRFKLESISLKVLHLTLHTFLNKVLGKKNSYLGTKCSLSQNQSTFSDLWEGRKREEENLHYQMMIIPFLLVDQWREHLPLVCQIQG